MEMLGRNNELFKNVFPDYQSFKSWYQGLPLSENDVPSEKTFTLIAYEYNDSHISFSVEGFKQHFAVDLYTFYKEFEETTKSIIELMKLTDDEIATADSMIVNILYQLNKNILTKKECCKSKKNNFRVKEYLLLKLF